MKVNKNFSIDADVLTKLERIVKGRGIPPSKAVNDILAHFVK